MTRYFFHILNDWNFEDIDGLELPNLQSAREEAEGFARDLMRMEPDRVDWRGYVVRVSAEDRTPLFDLPFAAIR